jgi:hypothetical protein
MQYVVKQGQVIYDVAVQLYGDAQYSVKLCTDNNITITDSIDGLTLTYDEFIKKNIIAAAIKQQNTPQQPDNSYYIKQTQSVYDLALQFGYGIDEVANFCQLTGLNITSDSVGGQIIQVTKLPNNLPLNSIFATQFFEEQVVGYILMEDGFYLLQENDNKLLL